MLSRLARSIPLLACCSTGCAFDTSGTPGQGLGQSGTSDVDDVDGGSASTTDATHESTETSATVSSEDTDGDTEDVPSDQAVLQLSDAPVLDFGLVLLDTTVEHTITVQNTGTGEAYNLSAGTLSSPFGFVGGAYPGAGGTCKESLAAGESCTVVVELHPTIPTMASTELVLTYASGDTVPGEAKRPLTGGGVSGNLILNGDGELGGSPPAGGWIQNGPGSWFASACERAAPLGAPPGVPLAGERCLGHADVLNAPVGEETEIQQFIMLPDWDTAIDAGEVRFELSGFARSREIANDDWRVRTVFLDATAGLEPMQDTSWRTTADWERIEASAE
mgnify:FL=1